MSFFFIDHARKQATAKKAQLTTISHQQVATLHRLQCKVCPLAKEGAHTPQMAPTLGTGPIYFLAEAPGAHEDETSGKPLTGPTGRLLRTVVNDCGGDPDSCSYDNVVNCRPPKNRTPVWQEIECCRPRRWTFIERAKPKLIVGLGGIPAMMVLGSMDIAGLRGRFFAVKVGNHSCWFMPTYHPAYILRNAKNKAKPLNSTLGHCLRKDIEKAFAAVSYLKPPNIQGTVDAKHDVECFNGSGHIRLLALLAEARRAREKAVDLETKGLRPYSDGAAIMSAAISFGSTNFSFAIDHPEAKWTEAQKEDLLIAFADLLRDDTTKIAHNAPFELEWLAWLFGPEIVRHDVWECTMMQAHFLDERAGGRNDESNARVSKYLGLDWLIKQHFGTGYKAQFKLNKKDMSKTPIDEMLPYNGCDTKETLRLWQHQNTLLKRDGSYQAYVAALPTQPTVALMQHLGVNVDQRTVSQAQKTLSADIEALEFNISNLGVVQQFATDKKAAFNPASQPQVLEIFRDYLKRPEVRVTPSHGQVHNFDGQSTPKNHLHKTDQNDVSNKPRYSVDKNVLERIDHPLAKLMVRWRNRTKMKSTYVDGLSREELKKGSDVVLYPDGKLHTNFNSTATETGRLSSDGPNLQNFPKRNEAWLRAQIVPPAGYTMLAIDYGQLEACTGAMCSRDQYLTKALWDDYDIHMDWAKLLDKEQPRLRGDLDMKKFRSLVKNKLVFPAFYGASSESIAGYLTAATGHDVEVSYVDEVMDRFWQVLSGMKRWQDNLVKQYYETGYVSTLGGRKHRYPLNRNQVINHPFQGSAAELVCDAMNRLSMLAMATGKWYLHPLLNIHDDLTLCIPDNKLESAIETVLQEMLVFDFDWVNVPLSAEVSIGKNWADLKPLGKFFSHKEFNYPRGTDVKTREATNPSPRIQGGARLVHDSGRAAYGG